MQAADAPKLGKDAVLAMITKVKSKLVEVIKKKDEELETVCISNLVSSFLFSSFLFFSSLVSFFFLFFFLILKIYATKILMIGAQVPASSGGSMG